MTPPQPHPARAAILRAIIAAVLLLGTSALLKTLPIDAATHAGLKQRLLGVMMGGWVFLYANAIPKTLVPLAQLRYKPAAEQTVRRFVGWCMAMGGVGYTLAWIIAPVDIARVLAPVLLGIPMLAVVVRLVRWRITCASSPATPLHP